MPSLFREHPLRAPNAGEVPLRAEGDAACDRTGCRHPLAAHKVEAVPFHGACERSRCLCDGYVYANGVTIGRVS